MAAVLTNVVRSRLVRHLDILAASYLRIDCGDVEQMGMRVGEF
jgi:hypothetical protein